MSIATSRLELWVVRTAVTPIVPKRWRRWRRWWWQADEIEAAKQEAAKMAAWFASMDNDPNAGES